jgi:sulfate transport system ATP-binding protein
LNRERNGQPAWPAKVVRVTPLGAFVRIDVELTDGAIVRVELSRGHHAVLEPRIGETLFVAPRDLKVFVDELGHV